MKIRKPILVIFTIVVFCVGCKNVSDDIVGTWNFQTFDNQPQGSVTWTFKDDGSLIRIKTGDEDLKLDTCNYVVDKSMFKTQITINNSTPMSGLTDVNGLYRIDKFKDDILIMTRIRLADDSSDGAYLRCEMMRKN